MPITAPPENATCRAAGRPLRAALVVRMLAAVATRIPKNPDSAEQKAPNTNASETSRTGPCVDGRQHTATTTTTSASTLYSRRRNAIAPSRTAAPISCIRAFQDPAG
jgi:hypothetical protein